MIKSSQVYAFIDSQNLNLGIRNQGWDLDFKKFRIYLKDKYKVSRAYLFIGFVKKYQKLYNILKSYNYILIFKPTVIQKGETKGNVDAELVLTAVDKLNLYSKAIIIAGDGDYYCLVKYLIKKKKLGRVLIPDRYKYSRLLFPYIKHLDFLNNQQNKLSRK